MNKPSIHIATSQDIHELAQLLKYLFEQEQEFDSDTQKQSKGLKMIIKEPEKGFILMAKVNGKIAGMVSIQYLISTAEGGNVALLEDMIVRPEYQKMGIGSILIEKAIHRCKESGCSRISLLTDFDNEKAIQFYKSHGFRSSPMVPFRLQI